MVDGPRGKRGLAVILASGPLSPWRMDFLGIPVLQRMGLDVIHFDGDRLLRPNCEEKRESYGVDIDFSQFCEFVSVRRPIYVFSSYDLSNDRLKPIGDALKKNGVPWCRVAAGFIPGKLPAQGLRRQVSALWFNARRLVRQSGLVGTSTVAIKKGTTKLAQRLGFTDRVIRQSTCSSKVRRRNNRSMSGRQSSSQVTPAIMKRC